MLRRLMLKYPSGKLFRTKQGCLWTPANQSNGWGTAAGKVRKDKGEKFLPPEITLYATRHTFATRLLAQGVSIAAVAALLGNTISVCQKHYGHLELCKNVLWAAVRGTASAVAVSA